MAGLSLAGAQGPGTGNRNCSLSDKAATNLITRKQDNTDNNVPVRVKSAVRDTITLLRIRHLNVKR